VGCVVAGGEPVESSLKFDNKTVVELQALRKSTTKSDPKGKKNDVILFSATLLTFNKNGVLRISMSFEFVEFHFASIIIYNQFLFSIECLDSRIRFFTNQVLGSVYNV